MRNFLTLNPQFDTEGLNVFLCAKFLTLLLTYFKAQHSYFAGAKGGKDANSITLG